MSTLKLEVGYSCIWDLHDQVVGVTGKFALSQSVLKTFSLHTCQVSSHRWSCILLLQPLFESQVPVGHAPTDAAFPNGSLPALFLSVTLQHRRLAVPSFCEPLPVGHVPSYRHLFQVQESSAGAAPGNNLTLYQTEQSGCGTWWRI